MVKSSTRERAKARRRQEKRKTILIWGLAGIAVIGAVGFLIWNIVRPSAGKTIPVLAADHIDAGTPPGPYNTNPPTSGSHYASGLEAGFYNEADLARLPQNPEGNLVHNLEHGYVIFWYNCQLLDPAGCDNLKAQIQEVMDDFDGFKVIAFPWESIDVPVAMTSWGQLQEFDQFNPDQARRFVSSNRNRAPEPNAP